MEKGIPPYVGVHRIEIQAGPDGCVSIRPFGRSATAELPLTPGFLVLTQQMAQELAEDLLGAAAQSMEAHQRSQN